MTRTTIDDEAAEVTVSDKAGERRYPLASAEGFAAVSDAWLRAGWDAKHVYSFTWMGRPIIQLPEDMVRIQEVALSGEARRPDRDRCRAWRLAYLLCFAVQGDGQRPRHRHRR